MVGDPGLGIGIPLRGPGTPCQTRNRRQTLQSGVQAKYLWKTQKISAKNVILVLLSASNRLYNRNCNRAGEKQKRKPPGTGI